MALILVLIGIWCIFAVMEDMISALAASGILLPFVLALLILLIVCFLGVWIATRSKEERTDQAPQDPEGIPQEAKYDKDSKRLYLYSTINAQLLQIDRRSSAFPEGNAEKSYLRYVGKDAPGDYCIIDEICLSENLAKKAKVTPGVRQFLKEDTLVLSHTPAQADRRITASDYLDSLLTEEEYRSIVVFLCR